MKLLLHTCCGPCLIAPYERLEPNANITLFFYNPNIHPFNEFDKRLFWVEHFAQEAQMDLITYHYNPDKYLEKIAFDKPDRCQTCYRLRLMETARIAQMKDFEAFTTTMLSSPHQKHEVIMDIANLASKKYEVPFYYEDFRPFYRESVKTSKEIGMYRQQYCGCIYSLNERQEQLKAKKLKIENK